MFLVEREGVADAVLPIPEFRAHLHLGTGFSDDAVQDGVLERCLRAALAEIEAATGKAVFRRVFDWSLTAWRDPGRQVLPRAPVVGIEELALVDRLGARAVTDPARYLLDRDTHRPSVVASGFILPQIPVGGRVEIAFEAGYGAAWDEVPADLRQAVLLLATAHYEDRSGGGDMPARVEEILRPYRNLRLRAGGLR